MNISFSHSHRENDNFLPWLSSKTYILYTVLLVINLIVLIIPLAPMQPSAELDPSWMLSVNQAFSQDLVFGREFIFTIGPYGSLYTWQYHPATSILTLTSAIAFTFGWTIALLGLTAGRQHIALFLLSIFLLTTKSHDLMLLGYPFLIMLWTASYQDKAFEKKIYSRLTDLTKLYAISLLGLLPLVKLSTLPLCILATVMVFARLLQQARPRQAYICLLIPAITMSILWLAAKQPLAALPDYFINGNEIISGYSEAMAINGKTKMPALYLFICLLLATTILLSHHLPPPKKAYLLLSLSSFLFIIMKASFVRHDGHALLAGAGITFASAMTFILIRKKEILVILFASLLLNSYIYNHYRDFHPQRFFNEFTKTYTDSAEGLYKIMSSPNDLNQRHIKAMKSIESTSLLPKLSGTSDVYSYGQAELIASDNYWSPRPIIQSYSAYTSKLAELNRQHIIGPNAPDNIFFRVQPIDNRIPTLEDGSSWPTIMKHYEMTGTYGDYIHLRKRSTVPDMPLTPLLQQKINVGMPLSIPESTGGIYARFKFKKSLAGELANIFYKTSSIHLLIETDDGNKKTFRLIPKMTESGFIISPHIETTTDFSWLLTGRNQLLPQVNQITIDINKKYHFLWQKKVEVELFSFEAPAKSDIKIKPAGLSNNLIIPAPPPESSCAGAIDSVSVRPVTGSAKLLIITGWLVTNKNTGKAPDMTIVALQGESGKTQYFSSSSKYVRPDVSRHLKTSPTEPTGFTALIDVSGFSGRFEVGLAKQLDKNIEACTSPKKSVLLK